jgi:mRNA interferase MazF
MTEGDIVLAPLPQADGLAKNRPVILLRELPPYRDQYLISPSDTDFEASGLLSASVIRLGFLAVLPRRLIMGSIGSISPERHQYFLQTLSDYLTRNTTEAT